MFGCFDVVALCGLLLGRGILVWQGALGRAEGTRRSASARRARTCPLRHLDSQLERFAYWPELLSGETGLLRTLSEDDDPLLVEKANRHLNRVKHIAGALDIYLTDGTGLTVAASNWLDVRTFVGQKFAFRPYIKQAL